MQQESRVTQVPEESRNSPGPVSSAIKEIKAYATQQIGSFSNEQYFSCADLEFLLMFWFVASAEDEAYETKRVKSKLYPKQNKPEILSIARKKFHSPQTIKNIIGDSGYALNFGRSIIQQIMEAAIITNLSQVKTLYNSVQSKRLSHRIVLENEVGKLEQLKSTNKQKDNAVVIKKCGENYIMGLFTNQQVQRKQHKILEEKPEVILPRTESTIQEQEFRSAKPAATHHQANPQKPTQVKRSHSADEEFTQGQIPSNLEWQGITWFETTMIVAIFMAILLQFYGFLDPLLTLYNGLFGRYHLIDVGQGLQQIFVGETNL